MVTDKTVWVKQIFGFGDSGMLGIRALIRKPWLSASSVLCGICHRLLHVFGQVTEPSNYIFLTLTFYIYSELV